MKPERRQVSFIFNPQGGCGKSLTADYITLNPFDQLEQYLALNKRYPTTYLFQLTILSLSPTYELSKIIFKLTYLFP